MTSPMAPWGLMLPNFDPYRTGALDVVGAARRAEDLGFDAVWVGDHLSFHPPILEATMALAAAAAVTERVRVGTAVLLAPMRQPVWLAKSLQTLCHLAPGRAIAGFGVGGEHPAEWNAAGADVRGRGARLDEFLDLLDDLLGGRAVEHRGALEVVTPPLEPAVPRPPVAIGGRSTAAMRRAARHGDAWMAVWMDPAAVAERRAQLAEMAAEMDREPPETTMVIFAAVGEDADARRDAARLYQGQYALPWDVVEQWTACGAAQAVAERFQAYIDVGVSGFVIIPCRPDTAEQAERLAEVRSLVRF